jgi:hypothetical protein
MGTILKGFGAQLTTNIEDNLIEPELDARRLLEGFDSYKGNRIINDLAEVCASRTHHLKRHSVRWSLDLRERACTPGSGLPFPT